MSWDTDVQVPAQQTKRHQQERAYSLLQKTPGACLGVITLNHILLAESKTLACLSSAISTGSSYCAPTAQYCEFCSTASCVTSTSLLKEQVSRSMRFLRNIITTLSAAFGSR